MSERPAEQFGYGRVVTLMSIQRAHMGQHSGYHQLANYMEKSLISVSGSRKRGTGLAGILATSLAWASRGPWYSVASFRLELRGLWAMLRRRGQMVHLLQADNDLWITAIAKRLSGAHLVGTIHQPPSEIEKIGGPPASWQKLDTVVALSTSLQRYLEERLPNARVYFVPIGVDTDFFVPRTVRPDGPPHVITIGKHLRDTVTLTAVFENMRQRQPHLRLSVLGMPDEMRDRYLELGVEELSDLSDSELRSLYQSADVMILALRDAAANNALMEAMACGLPTVATGIAGTLDHATAESALLVPSSDPAAMTDAIVRLLDDAALHDRVAQAARNRALELSWPNIARRTSEIYGKG